MLIKYLRSLLEAFLNSKHDWVATQGDTDLGRRIDITFPNGGPKNDKFVAPLNGYVTILYHDGSVKTGIWVGTVAHGTNALNTVTSPTTNGWAGGWIRVNKGDTINFYTDSTSVPYCCYFVPSLGS